MIKTFLFIVLILVLLILFLKQKKSYIIDSNVRIIEKEILDSNSNTELHVKSAIFDNKSRLHLLTNKGPKIINNDNDNDNGYLRMENNNYIPSIANNVGYYSKTNQVFYILPNGELKFIDNDEKIYAFNELYNIDVNPTDIISIVPFENYTFILLKDKTVFKYCHKTEKVIDEIKDLPNFNYEFLLNDPLYDTIHLVNDKSNIFITYKDSNQKLIERDYSNFFRNKVHIHNFGIVGLSNPTELNNNNNNGVKVDDNGIQTFIIPKTREYTIELVGAGYKKSGKGAKIIKTVNLVKGDVLKFLIGNSGYKMPCCENEYEIKNSILPTKNSCSGSGASAMTLNGKLELIAGGGGGWSSEYVSVPNLCNSTSISKNNDIKKKASFIIPIKKIDFSKPVLIDNIQSFNFTIPKINTNNGRYYTLKEELVDYKITLKKSTKLPISFKINDKYEIRDYNSLEITPDKLFEKIYSNKLFTTLNSKKYQKNTGAKEGFDIKSSNDPILLKKNSYCPKNSESNILFGGFGGGGFASKSKSSYLCNSGGGGGYTGGNCCVSDFNLNTDGTSNTISNLDSKEDILFNQKMLPIPETAACGGTCFTNTELELELPTRYYNFNDAAGYANIYFNDNDNDDDNTNTNNDLKITSFNSKKNIISGKITNLNNCIVKIELEDGIDSIDFEILLYPDENSLKYSEKIIVSCHTNHKNGNWNEIYSYYQNGYPYTSDEIVPKKIRNEDQYLFKYLNNYCLDNKKLATYFTSDSSIKHVQSFNLVENSNNVYIVMKFTGKYKIILLKHKKY